MRVWIVNYYNGTPIKYSNPRYIQFAKFFMSEGWQVTTFNAIRATGEKAQSLFERKQYEDYDFVNVKASSYSGNGLQRTVSIFRFAWNIYRHCQEFERPDVILHNVHTPFDYPILWAAKRLKSRYVAEAWDAWPDVFEHLGLISRHHPMLKVFYWIEKRLYQHADQIVFTFLGGLHYLQKKHWTLDAGGKIDMRRVHYINNGVDLEQFDKDAKTYSRPDRDINDPNVIKIIYLGKISRANHVLTLIEAAKMIDKDSPYRFFIYGDGSDRKELEKKVADEGINNVIFKEKRIPFSEVAWVVSQATVNVMNYQQGFGYMGVSSGKLFQYLAAGKPIICNVSIDYDDIITDNSLGIAKNIFTAEDFVQSIRQLAEQPKASYDAMCERVRKTAERFDFKRLAAQEIEVIKAACK